MKNLKKALAKKHEEQSLKNSQQDSVIFAKNTENFLKSDSSSSDQDEEFEEKQLPVIKKQYGFNGIPNSYAFKINDESSDEDDEEIFKDQVSPKINEQGKNTIYEIRNYQKELFKNSYSKNSIIYLETGAGKTMIATMLINYFFQKQKKAPQKKKIIFLANTVQLVKQQYAEIKNNLQRISEMMENDKEISQILKFQEGINYRRIFEKENHIVKCHGSYKQKDNLQIETFTKQKWDYLLENYEIFVMIGQVLLNGLRRGYIRIEDIEVIIYDECHHTRQDHPYCLIQYEFYHFHKRRNEQVQLPKIYGLTASPVLDIEVKSDSNIMKKKISELCTNLDANFVKYNIEESKKYIKEATICVEEYGEEKNIQERANQFLQEQIIGEKWISDIEDKQNEEMRYTEILNFYIKFQQFKNSYFSNLSPMNKQILLDIEKIICLYSMQVDAQLGKYSVSLFLKDVNDELQKLGQFQHNNEEMQELKKLFKAQTEKFIESVDKSEKNISKKFMFLYNKLKQTMIHDKEEFECYKVKNKYYEQEFHQHEKITKVQKYIKDNQSMILVFVEEKIIIKYLQKLLQIWMDDEDRDKDEDEIIFRYKKIVCLTGQSNFQDRKKKNLNKNQYQNSEFTQNDNFEFAEEEYRQQQMKQESLISSQINKEEDIDSLKEKINDHQKSAQRCVLVNLDFEVSKQSENIEAFRKKELQIILSTSVTEEGFDIPSCNLVISFNKISNLKSFVQIKGRARKENSKFIIMAKDKYQKQDYETDIESYKDLIQQIKEIAPKVEKQEIEIRPNYKYKIVKETGAILNTNWSVNLFHTYANQLLYSYDSNIKGPFYYYIEITNVGFICQIIVPSQSGLKTFCSNPQAQKEDAKKDACFQAVIILYRQYKIFDQYLRNISQKIQNSQSEKSESLFEDEKDEKLTKILQKYCKSYVDVKQKCKMYYFQSVMGECFKQSFFKSILDIQQQKSYTFQLYLIKFNDQGKKLPSSGFIKNQDSELGIIHSTQIPIKDTIKYYLQMHENEVYANMIYQQEIQISQQQYDKLMLINRFLNSVALNKDIEFYAEYTGEVVNGKGKLFKDHGKNASKNLQYKFDNSEGFSALLTVIRPSNNNTNLYEINFDHIEILEKYINYMSGVYKVRNKTKLNEEEKAARFQSRKLKQDDPFADYKVKPYYDCVNFFDCTKQLDPNIYQDSRKKLVLQSIMSGRHLNRFIFYGCKSYEEIQKEYQQVPTGKDPFKQIKQLKAQVELEEVSFTSNENHMVLQVQLFTKHLRSQTNLYLKRVGVLTENFKGDYKYSPHQFTIFPLNVSLLMKLNILHKTFLYQIRDTFGVHHFQQIRLPKFFDKAYQRIKNNNKTSCSYNLDQIEQPHFLVENYQGVLDVMSKSEKYNQFCKKYNNHQLMEGYNQISIRKFDQKYIKHNPIFESYQVYKKNIFELQISELMKSLTSLEYAVNNKESSLERYEFLGDTVLKCLSSTQIYFEHPKSMEDHLHVHRTIIIQNRNLAQIAVKKKIFKYILSSKIETLSPIGIKYEIAVDDDEQNQFQKEKEPDEYDKADQRNKNKKGNEEDGDAENEEIEEQQQQNDIPNLLRLEPTYRHIKGKTLADTLESIIGVFFQQKKDLNLCQYLLFSLQVLNKPDLTFNHSYDRSLQQSQLQNPIYVQLKEIESILGYTFQNINLLFQAFTLPSIESLCIQIPSLKNTNLNKLHQINNAIQKKENQGTFEKIDQISKENQNKIYQKDSNEWENLKNYNLCNQRLEFLGDAVLDLIIVEYLFNKFPNSDPGELTQMKTSLVQNKTLCLINLMKGFYKFIIGSIQHNKEEIELLLNNVEMFMGDTSLMYDTTYNQSLIKTLGDVIESLVGAIFIDNNLDYEITKKIVMETLFAEILQYFTGQEHRLKNLQLYIEKVLKKEFGKVSLIEDETDIKEGKKRFFIQSEDNNKEVSFEVYAYDQIDAIDQIYIEINQKKRQKK
ncbi:dicer-related RNase III protein Dcr2p, putative (macronuclear) [Tetrahymena thermophila SB210]|uniref:Dicer-related RNase III protein Dcr2p, putative n=2 Tax=Tetrahymena thermophila TaxID=5911 RepID=A4VD87_TETTS|nr:dicer-related RNase III protein Dcr2p, putative [Tetrahymena thermophila SB210]EDK31487.2 dicer-related RNase III protein Dcr2p, putative [Tetrahymena thermophila SB210]|eukprot:XP_001470932.2 dicer-related RNase III protein Dcr2p, putative [Tetrahymena thermophila SB210]